MVCALRDQKTGTELPLDPDALRIVIGAADHCTITLEDSYLSGVHCSLERRGRGRFVVRDRMSKNGTFVNGNRIELAELRPGGLLRVGRTSLVAVGAAGRTSVPALERMIGCDPLFRRAIDMAVRAARSRVSVLIVGETGTGKELFARLIHEMSVCSDGPFVPLNCGAIPPGLAESELFGHEKGAFTGAVAARDGVFIRANGGTLFLDEVGELAREQQPRLLRVLEVRKVRRVGGSAELPTSARVVAATNRSADLGTDASPLRLDLFHRLAAVVIELCPLRDRASDIPALVRSFMDDLAAEHGPRTISSQTMAALCEYHWPGNIRELRQAIWRATALCEGELALGVLLPTSGARCAERSAVPRLIHRETTELAPPPAAGRDRPSGPAALTSADDAMRELITRTLHRYGTIRRSARALGIPKSTLADRIRAFGIRPANRG
ncbi:MAG TPA: sigma 54-interacting transcriptional regulator [Kofleriaceae bacterium]|nr:sigma 54-interacting transcriptional regulator [Kofleriaceae bacterium]